MDEINCIQMYGSFTNVKIDNKLPTKNMFNCFVSEVVNYIYNQQRYTQKWKCKIPFAFYATLLHFRKCKKKLKKEQRIWNEAQKCCKQMQKNWVKCK